MANNPSNHRPSFDTWLNEIIDDMDQAAINLYNRADTEFLPKVALCSSLEGYTAAVKWTDIVNGVINTIESYGREDLAKTLALSLHRAAAFPEEFMLTRGLLVTDDDGLFLFGDEE